MWYYWLFMLTAIVTEVCGTLAMKYNTGETQVLGMSIMYGMLIISYTSLAIAVQRIPLIVAYGAWESLGLALIAICSHFLFSEPLGLLKLLGITVTIIGILLLECGTDAPDH